MSTKKSNLSKLAAFNCRFVKYVWPFSGQNALGKHWEKCFYLMLLPAINSFLSDHTSHYIRPAYLLKKKLWHRCFPVKFLKFSTTPFLLNTSGRLFLNFFGGVTKSAIWEEILKKFLMENFIFLQCLLLRIISKESPR